jgi:protein-tyrosine-phosphatase/DNA-binding transcriptional ArsR family regulator
VDVPAAPPAFLRLAAHPVRWRLLRELARSDRRVRELTALLGRPQSLVSYRLGRLRDGRLVTAQRSSADGRDAYYAIDLARCGELLSASGAALHPGLELAPPPDAQPRAARVLFVCTGNSARSPMAEALLGELAGGSVQALSAGTRPMPLDERAVAALRAYGIDLSGRRPRHVDELAGECFDRVITLCDRAREVCPELPGQPELVHWSIAEPAAEEGLPAFARTAAELETRIRFLLHAIGAP